MGSQADPGQPADRAYGLACLPVFLWGLVGSGCLRPGEDALEPLALLFAPVAFNACYTLGWLVEASLRLARPGLPPSLGPRLLAAGLAFSFCVVGLPAVLWGGCRCLQILGVAA